MFKNENKCGIGVVIQNNQGLIIASLSQQLPRAFQAFEIEAIAYVDPLIKDAIHFSRYFLLNYFILTLGRKVINWLIIWLGILSMS